MIMITTSLNPHYLQQKQNPKIQKVNRYQMVVIHIHCNCTLDSCQLTGKGWWWWWTMYFTDPCTSVCQRVKTKHGIRSQHYVDVLLSLHFVTPTIDFRTNNQRSNTTFLCYWARKSSASMNLKFGLLFTVGLHLLPFH